MKQFKIIVFVLMIGIFGGISIDRWYEEQITPTVYAAQEEEPRTVLIGISYLKWDKTRLQEEIRAHLPEIFIEIARCESQTHQYDRFGDVLTGNIDPDDTGVLQINKRYHLDTASALGLDLDTPVGNIAYAKNLYERKGLTPWDSSRKCWST